MTPIESTGEKLTMKEREVRAIQHIKVRLALIREHLLMYGRGEAAEHCAAAIGAIVEMEATGQ